MVLTSPSVRFYEGGDLAAWLSASDRSAATIRLVLAQVAQALQYLHGSGHWHADVKLENVLMDRAGNPHLADFELARGELAGSTATATVFAAGGGTADYLAPEGAASDIVAGAAADMFAFGVCAARTFLPAADCPRDGFTLRLPAACDDAAAGLLPFVAELGVVEATERLTAAECLLHPFLSPAAAAEEAARREAEARDAEAAGLARVQLAETDAAAQLQRRREQQARREADAGAALAQRTAAQMEMVEQAETVARQRQADAAAALAQDVAAKEEAAEQQARELRRQEAALGRELQRQQLKEAAARQQLREQQEEQAERVRLSDAAVRRQQHELRGQLQRLGQDQEAVKNSRGDVEAARRRVATQQRDAKTAQDKLQQQQVELRRQQQELQHTRAQQMREPTYWARARPADAAGFTLHAITEQHNR